MGQLNLKKGLLVCFMIPNIFDTSGFYGS